MTIEFDWPEHFKRQRDEWVLEAVKGIMSDAERYTASPIEAMFFAALYFQKGFDGEPMRLVTEEAHIGSVTAPGWTVFPQRQIGKYRVDFWILASNYGISKSIIVECDGHDFHEKTKAQAAKDKSRDRYLQAQGHMVFRFTGSEIHKNAIDCVSFLSADIDGLLYKEMERYHAASRSEKGERGK